MKTICTILYYVLRWLGIGPVAIIDGIVCTLTLSIYRPLWGRRVSFWAWDHLRAPFIPK